MRYFLIEREKTVAEIAENAYRNLPAAARAKAEAALIRANPELGTPDKVRPGALVRVPSGPGFRNLDDREVIDPVKAMADQVAGQLEALQAEVKHAYAASRKRRKAGVACLKTAGKELKKRPEDAARAAKLAKHLREADKKDREQRELGLEAIGHLRELAAAIRDDG